MCVSVSLLRRKSIFYLKQQTEETKSNVQSFYLVYLALGELVKLYIDAINDPHAIPNVTKAWDIFVNNKIADAKQDALKDYDQSMIQLTRLPCVGEKLLEDHEFSEKQATKKFMEETAELNCTTLKDELTDLIVSKSYHLVLKFS